MPHQTVWTDKGCHLTVYDCIDGSELVNINNEMCGSEHFDSIDYFIRDLSRIQINRLQPSDLLEAAYINSVASSYKPHLRGTFIVSDPITESHVQNYIEQSRRAGNPWKMKIFHDMKAALQWATASTSND